MIVRYVYKSKNSEVIFMIKKTLSFALAQLICFSAVSCGSGTVKKPETTEKAVEPSAQVIAWTTHSYDKIIVNTEPKGELKCEYTVYSTKGETEGCTVAVRSSTDIKSATLTLASGNTDTVKVSMFSMNKSHTVDRRREYTDSLIPYYGRKLPLDKDVTLPFMIEFTTAEDTPAGDHKYVFEYKDADGKVLASFNITLHVWNIVLPKDKTFATAFGLHKEWISVNGGVTEDLYKTWYDIHLEHNICGYELPYGILDERADAYMSDPRVTAFRVPHFSNNIDEVNDAELLKIYEKLKSNPVWLEKAYFYPIDEPEKPEQLERLKAWAEKLSALCPGIEIVAPYYTNIKIADGVDQTDYMEEFTKLWCPKLCFWDDEQCYDKFLDFTPAKSFAERMEEQRLGGDRIWSYVANDPDDPYAQMFLDTEGVNQRLMFWQCYQRNVVGFLYWGTNYYGYNSEGGTRDPWNTVDTGIPNGDNERIYGCGFLFYPGTKVGIPGCVPSIRAKIVRDGIDDIELFYLAETVLGKDWLLSKTYEATPSLTEFTDGDTFAALRIEIGNAIEAAMN